MARLGRRSRLMIGALALLLAPAGAAEDEASVSPLPGNAPCSYPAQAQAAFVAGPVTFQAHVRPDGTVESVEPRQVPLPDLGFAEAIGACISTWRFEALPGDRGTMRSYFGVFRYQLAAEDEAAIRGLFEALALAWNAGNEKALEELALGRDDGATVPADARSLREQLLGPGELPFRMELEPDVEHIRFLQPDRVGVRQGYGRRENDAVGASELGEAAALSALVAKGARGWRLVRVADAAWSDVHRSREAPASQGRTFTKPSKIRDVAPRFPPTGNLGVVVIDAIVSAEGKVTRARVVQGLDRAVDNAAIEAVRKWAYSPALLDGKPVPTFLTVVVNLAQSKH